MGLGEALSRDQLVLELGCVAVGEGIPVARSVGSPDAKRPSGELSGTFELPRKGRGALEIYRHHRQSAFDLVAQDSQQRGRLACAAGADDQAVGGELAVAEADLTAALVNPQTHRAVLGLPGGALGSTPRRFPRRRDRDLDGGPGEQRGDSPAERHRDQHRECDQRPVRRTARARRRVHRASSERSTAGRAVPARTSPARPGPCSEPSTTRPPARWALRPADATPASGANCARWT